VRRQPHLSRYERSEIYEILDATNLCSVGVVIDGAPLVLPTLYCRDGDTLLLHGSQSALLLRSMLSTPQVCVSVMIVDGFIVARSAFNSSMAYRSVTLFGGAERIEDQADAERALEILTDAILPGRTGEVRPPLESELSRTTVLRFTIEEGSAKVSEGPPEDELEDLDAAVWAGVVPIMMTAGAPLPATDGAMTGGQIRVPTSVEALQARYPTP
jgi:nitroimidazol reductase NimA-like FMN-containing flavoprotein (pyridoxamine 5'-phosphate oxidase superfamily)